MELHLRRALNRSLAEASCPAGGDERYRFARKRRVDLDVAGFVGLHWPVEGFVNPISQVARTSFFRSAVLLNESFRRFPNLQAADPKTGSALPSTGRLPFCVRASPAVLDPACCQPPHAVRTENLSGPKGVYSWQLFEKGVTPLAPAGVRER